jgi:hypothetical protein
MAKTPTEIASLARSFTQPALKTLAAIMRQPKAPAAARVQACVALLDRGWGKPKQTVGGDPENPLAMTISEIRHTIVDPRHKRSDDQD